MNIDNDLDNFRLKMVMVLCKLMDVVKDKAITFEEPIKVMRYYRNIPQEMFSVTSINGGLFNGVAKLSMEVVNLTDENKEQTIGYKNAVTWSIESLSCESIMSLIYAVQKQIINTASAALDDYRGKNIIVKGLEDYLENEYFPTK
jgi:hypothetical protein